MRYLLMIFLVFPMIGIGQSVEELQYAAYLKTSKTMWERSISIVEKSKGAQSFEKGLALYGLLNNTMASKDEESFDQYIDQTIDLLKALVDENPTWGEPHAVLSSVYGLVMAYSPMKGMMYGMKSSSLMESAIKSQPESPLVQKLYAGSKLYTPSMFGGSPEKAVGAFEKSVELFELADTENNWLYIDTLVGLSMAYIKTERKDLAKSTLEKAITIEPEHGWAKSILASLER